MTCEDCSHGRRHEYANYEGEGLAVGLHGAGGPAVGLAHHADDESTDGSHEEGHHGHLELVDDSGLEELPVGDSVPEGHPQDGTHDGAHEHARDDEYVGVGGESSNGNDRGPDEVDPGVDVHGRDLHDVVVDLLRGQPSLLEVTEPLESS